MFYQNLICRKTRHKHLNRNSDPSCGQQNITATWGKSPQWGTLIWPWDKLRGIYIIYLISNDNRKQIELPICGISMKVLLSNQVLAMFRNSSVSSYVTWRSNSTTFFIIMVFSGIIKVLGRPSRNSTLKFYVWNGILKTTGKLLRYIIFHLK